MATEDRSIEGREEEEVYHLDSNLSAEFLAMKVLKKGQSKTYVSL